MAELEPADRERVVQTLKATVQADGQAAIEHDEDGNIVAEPPTHPGPQGPPPPGLDSGQPRPAQTSGQGGQEWALHFWDSVSWDKLHEKVPTIVNVPRQAIPVVAEFWERLLRDIHTANEAADAMAQERLWKALLFSGRLLFGNTIPRGGKRGSGAACEVVAGRARRALAGEWSGLWEESLLARDGATRKRRKPVDRNLADVMEIQACLAAGAPAKALRVVRGPTALATDEVARADLPKHFGASIHPLPPRAATATDLDMEAFEDALLQSLKESARRSGAGPGGTRLDHLREVLGTPDRAHLLAQAFRGVLAPGTPGCIWDGICAGTCIPLAKGK